MNVDIIILAAGQGKRMQSNLPKVLQPLGNKPLLQHVIDTCSQINKSKLHIVVGGHNKLIQSSVKAPRSTNWVLQRKQLGTGHAVKQTLPSLRHNSCVVVLYGDGPLVRIKTLKKLSSASERKVLKLWEGLGYYRRCRNLMATAKIVTKQKKSILPKTLDDIKKLPGIGDYTGNILLALVYNQPRLALSLIHI
mgnify:CR=1 FL=1